MAYIVRSGSATECEDYALIEFRGVLQHTFGYPNDEALGGHPAFKSGLKSYAFNVIGDSPYVAELGARNATIFPGSESHYGSFTHWIVAFHDETLEVIGQSAGVVGRIEARSAHAAIRWYVEQKPEFDRPAPGSFVEE